MGIYPRLNTPLGGMGLPLSSPMTAPMPAPMAGPMYAPMPAPMPGPMPAPVGKPKFFGEGGMGRILAGVIGDALAQNGGMRPVYAPMVQARQQAQAEEAQWSRRREADNEDWTQREQWKRNNPEPDISPMERDAAAWARMTPEARTGYGQMKQAGAGDPDVFVTLSNGQVYAGPKSGLAQALMGGAPQGVPQAPVGNLRPIGGSTPPASGNFRP